MARQRGSVVLRRIEERRRRGICFRKRRAGLVKKAEELAVLCDADVGLLVINPFDGTFQRFAAPATMENIIKRYQNFPEAQKRAHRRRLLKELEAYRIATLHEKGKATPEERDFMEMVSRKEQTREEVRYVTRSQQSSREVDLTLSLGIGIGCNVGCSHRHQRPIDLNIP